MNKLFLLLFLSLSVESSLAMFPFCRGRSKVAAAAHAEVVAGEEKIIAPEYPEGSLGYAKRIALEHSRVQGCSYLDFAAVVREPISNFLKERHMDSSAAFDACCEWQNVAAMFLSEARSGLVQRSARNAHIELGKAMLFYGYQSSVDALRSLPVERSVIEEHENRLRRLSMGSAFMGFMSPLKVERLERWHRQAHDAISQCSRDRARAGGLEVIEEE